MLGEPLKDAKVIHIAWTNGKGSVSKMVFAILKGAWEDVGVFTSPHLFDIRERFVTHEGQITKQEFLECVNDVESTGVRLSYFERCTLISFLFFRRRAVEYAIVEVWLGGLLDSTNVIDPYITAITSIWNDHMEFLWDTLEEISAQKAGIIKPGAPIVYNHENQVIQDTAIEKGAPVIYTDKQVDTNLVWEYQQSNAAIAYEIAKYIWISNDLITKWLQQVEHPWRLQYLQENLLIDGAHNKQWLTELKKYLDSIRDNFENIVYCIALKNRKTPDLILDIFWQDNTYILVDTPHKMCASTDQLQQAFTREIEVSTAAKITEQATRDRATLYVVFGSLYVIGEFYQ